jgi:peptidoglycan/xylan/chitin deacetylase (PgdA/CDA1 family)
VNLLDKLSDQNLVIYLFHGVVEESNYSVRNYTRKHLVKSFFAKFIKELKACGHPMSMAEVAEHHQARKPYPPKSFAITFDDGFENNYSVAAPILKELNVPATFYITTGFIEKNGMSWIDRIEYCLENTSAGELKFSWDNKAYPFRTPAEKIRILRYLRNHVKNDSSIQVDDLVSQIFDQCKLPEVQSNQDPLDLKMNWQQVRELSEDSCFIVGGHSHRHAILSFLEPEELKSEIGTSLDLLKNNGVKTQHYSYPEGMRHCYSEQVIQVLKEYGIVCCPTAEEGVNQPSDDLFHLKRVNVVP